MYDVIIVFVNVDVFCLIFFIIICYCDFNMLNVCFIIYCRVLNFLLNFFCLGVKCFLFGNGFIS